MNLKILDKKDMDKVINFMDENNIIFKEQSGYESFILEESASVLDSLVYNNKINSNLIELKVNDIIDEIADTIFQNHEYYINNEYIYEVAEEVLNKYK